jgi:peptidoglycan/LPS O-acetylase OafA/YrhL
MNIKKNYGRTNFITSLRGIAALMVFMIHSGGGGVRELGDFFNAIVDTGAYGVDFFFVISGYTIFNQLLSKKYSIKSFILLRITRISIPYYPLLIILFLLFNIFNIETELGWAKEINNGEVSFLNFFSHLIYISPYKLEWQNTIIGIEWTLGIEVFYYFFFALLSYINIIKYKIKNILFTAFLIFILMLIPQCLKHYYNFNSMFLHWLPFKYSYMFFFGGISYFFRYYHEKNKFLTNLTISNKHLYFIILLFFILIFLSSYFNIYKINLVRTFLILITTVLITFYKIDIKKPKLLENKILIYFGSISYSFYLLHFPIILYLPKTGLIFLDFLISLTLCTILSTIWYKYLEIKLYNKIKLRIMNRF